MFTREGDTVTELVPDGFGGFSELDESGQTFYYKEAPEMY